MGWEPEREEEKEESERKREERIHLVAFLWILGTLRLKMAKFGRIDFPTKWPLVATCEIGGILRFSRRRMK